MQRITCLPHLGESMSNIPPDIQNCLLTIAQFGCEPDQVKRWYKLVRQHFGVGGDPESPHPGESMPPPRQRPQHTPSQSLSSTSSQMSPASYQGSAVMSDALSIQQSQAQQLAPSPWTTPAACGFGFDSSPICTSFEQHSNVSKPSGDFEISPYLEIAANLPLFPGPGQKDSDGADFSASAFEPRPVPHELSASSAALPVFIEPGSEAFPTAYRAVKADAADSLPASNVRTSVPLEPTRKRSRASFRQTPRTTEPVPRPRRSRPLRSIAQASRCEDLPHKLSISPRGPQQTGFVDLTQPSAPILDVGSVLQPVQSPRVFYPPEQNLYSPFQHRQQLHPADSSHQHGYRIPPQDIQQRVAPTVSPRPLTQSPGPREEAAQSDTLYRAIEPAPYKSPYAFSFVSNIRDQGRQP